MYIGMIYIHVYEQYTYIYNITCLMYIYMNDICIYIYLLPSSHTQSRYTANFQLSENGGSRLLESAVLYSYICISHILYYEYMQIIYVYTYIYSLLHAHRLASTLFIHMYIKRIIYKYMYYLYTQNKYMYVIRTHILYYKCMYIIHTRIFTPSFIYTVLQVGVCVMYDVCDI